MLKMGEFAEEQSETRESVDPVQRVKCVKIWSFISIVIFLVDFLGDIGLCIRYFYDGQVTYGVSTVLCVMLPHISTTLVSSWMYLSDVRKTEDDDSKEAEPENHDSKKAQPGNDDSEETQRSLWQQISPLCKYLLTHELAVNAETAKKNNKVETVLQYVEQIDKENADIALLSVIHTFIHAAPQQVLQLSIIFHSKLSEPSGTVIPPGFLGWPQICSIVLSVLSTSLPLTSYHRNIRLAQENKKKISTTGISLIFLGNLCLIVPRILVLSALLSLSWWWTLFAHACHWLVFSILLTFEPHAFCSWDNHPLYEKILKLLFSLMMGIVYLFTIILLIGEGSTAWRYGTYYYAICFIENISGAMIWQQVVGKSSFLPYNFFLISSIGFYVMGIVILVSYYVIFHPSKQMRKLKHIYKNKKSHHMGKKNIANPQDGASKPFQMAQMG